MHRHVHVCRKYRHKQTDNPPSGQRRPPRDQEQKPEDHLGGTADKDQFSMQRQIRRHDADVEIRFNEVIDAGYDEDRAERITRECFEAVSIQGLQYEDSREALLGLER